MGRILLRSVRRDARVSGSRASRGTGYNEMITIKRTAVIIFMIFFIFISAFDCRYFSYADTVSEWTNVTTNDQLADAFRYYCKSNDLTIEGSVADGVTTFTTYTFQNICNAIGIDMTALQANIKYRTDNSGNIEYLFDSTGVTAYNRIFSQFLQDNNIEVGDSVNDTLYSGYIYVDYEGHNHLCTVINSTGNYNNVVAVGERFHDLNYIMSCCQNGTTPTTVTIKTSSSDTYEIRYTTVYNSYLYTNITTAYIYKNGSYFGELPVCRANGDVLKDIGIGYFNGTYYFGGLNDNNVNFNVIGQFNPNNGNNPTTIPIIFFNCLLLI